LISEALRHYQRLENEKSTRKSDKEQHRRHYHIKECKIRPIIVQQAITHKIKVCEKKEKSHLLNKYLFIHCSQSLIISIRFNYVVNNVHQH
jgi:hypothetical protein